MRLECPIHGLVPRDETVRGYETNKGEYVRFEAEELKALEQASSSAVVIDSFVGRCVAYTNGFGGTAIRESVDTYVTPPVRGRDPREGGRRANSGTEARGRAQAAAPRVLAQVAEDGSFTHPVHTPVFPPLGGPQC